MEVNNFFAGIMPPYVPTVLLVLNILLAMAIVFLERRNITATWAWVMILGFIPIVGFILYLIFGQNLSKRKIFTWDKKSKEYIKKIVANQRELLQSHMFDFHNPINKKHQHLIAMLLNNDRAIFTQDNEVDLFIDGREKFDSLFQDLENAKHHIHMLYYILRSDELGTKLGNLLIKKAKEGVKIRLLYDDMGSRGLSRKLVKSIRAAGGEVEAFFPARFPLVNLRLNYRNHRKLVIIDGNIGYIGGFNVGDEYLGLNEKFGYWRDTHLRVKGEAVHHIQSRFILDWNQASKHDISFKGHYYPPASPRGDVGVQIVSSGPDSQWEQIKNGYIKLILSAERYIYIQTPYFIPDDSLLDALRIAALSGVKVKIMIPDKPDHPFVYWATYSYIGELLKAGADVYIYENGFLHAKTIVIDDEIASVGTANIDVRSFRLNFEVNAFLYHYKTAMKLAAIFEDDMLKSKKLTREIYDQRSYYIRFKESISRLLSPIL
ncbi:cardiolipin synthase [Priestia endophytica]|uniref:cardiolipin synthase n=1 Tax=Priestia endophytica TaxID=135735 RepID=UPI00227FD9E1|nr:cardiolipin synthase [Priestia endophytica]MCY8231076.1 cardiolipin synthase [Priestia endophytica]